MKFVIDAQLPRRLVYRLRKAGYEAIHTLDLPQKNKTADGTINELSMQEEWIVVTKDTDFVNSFLLLHRPYKLLLVSTGNINNTELESLFLRFLEAIVQAFSNYDFIEIDRTKITFHM
jgi:predicted nuclease of predicted toxin-antitoxin system